MTCTDADLVGLTAAYLTAAGLQVSRPAPRDADGGRLVIACPGAECALMVSDAADAELWWTPLAAGAADPYQAADLAAVLLSGERGARHPEGADGDITFKGVVGMDLRAGGFTVAELGGQLALHRGGRDSLQGAEDRAQAGGVVGAPFAVAEGPRDAGDLVVDVVLRVAVSAGALQPGGDDQPGGLEPARFAVVDPGAVVAGAGDPGPGLQVLERGPVGPVQDLLERLLPPGPVRGRPAGLRPGGRGARFPGSRRAAPRWTWRTRP